MAAAVTISSQACADEECKMELGDELEIVQTNCSQNLQDTLKTRSLKNEIRKK